ncbi:MAG: DUF3536 domain-containing protein [Candidatus Limnocylindrales bacterium]
MIPGQLAIHGHFYQPAREDPFSGAVPPDPTAAPHPDWNGRIAAECYGPNAAAGNFGRISFDLGPTLATWLRRERPETHDAIVAQAAHGNVLAQAFHHTILPLATPRDRRTEIRWGLRDAELRFGRRPTGLWLPETAVDLLTLRIAAEEGVTWTILAPWQAAATKIETRRPYRVEVGGGRHIVVLFYDGSLSAAVSFEAAATSDAREFAAGWVGPRLAAPVAEGLKPLVLVATDGELYGHHLPFRELFLEALTEAPAAERGFAFARPGRLPGGASVRALPAMAIRDQTSWSCHHGVLRWSGACADARDGRWKQPLRAAFDRLAAAVDAVSERETASLGIDAWAARDAWVDVAGEHAGATEVLTRIITDARGPAAAVAATDPAAARRLETVMQAQRSRLAMFASDGWFWEDPAGVETAQALRLAAHAARTIDGLACTRLEAALVADLGPVRSPATGQDGPALYTAALEAVGQQPIGLASPAGTGGRA